MDTKRKTIIILVAALIIGLLLAPLAYQNFAVGNQVSADLIWSGGFLWSGGHLWSGGFLWSGGHLWSGGFLWSGGHLWSGGFLWSG